MAGIIKGFNTNINSQQWTATEGQTTFTLLNSKYTPNKNQIEVYVAGFRQHSGNNFFETNSTSFTLSEGVPAGTSIEAKWIDNSLPSFSIGHSSSHKLGGVDPLNIKDLTDYENVITKYNMKEHGADANGVVDCSALLDVAQATGRTIYFPKGTYYINYWRPAAGKGSVHMVGDGEQTIIKVGSILRPYDDWIVEDIKFVSTLSAGGNSIFGIDPDSNGNKHNFTMRRCICTTEKTTSPDIIQISVTGCKHLRIEDSTFFYGGLQILSCEYFWVLNNYFNTYFVNANNEQIHANQDCSGIIAGNLMYNTAQDFIDLYVNGKNMIVENNHCEGFTGNVMEIKVIFRDATAGYGNESNKVGAWKNLIVRNNNFSGGRGGNIQMFNLATTDERTTPTTNDYQYYGRFLIFEGNYIDDTLLDGTGNGPVDTDNRTIFAIRGLSNVNISNNTVVMNYGIKRVFYLTSSSIANSTNSQLTKNIRFEGNNIVHKFGYTSANDIYVFYGGNVDGMIVKNNTFPYNSHILHNIDFPITNAIFDSNLFDNINNETLSSSYRHVWLYIGGSTLTFRNMTLWGVMISTPTSNGQNLSIDFIDCSFTSTLLLGYLDMVRFINCKFKSTDTAISFNAITKTLYLISCVFASGTTNYYLNGGSYITNYFPRDIYTDTSRSSLWYLTVPAKTDLTSKY